MSGFLLASLFEPSPTRLHRPLTPIVTPPLAQALLNHRPAMASYARAGACPDSEASFSESRVLEISPKRIGLIGLWTILEFRKET